MEEDGEREAETQRRRKTRTRKKRKHGTRDKKIANALYDAKWVLVAIAIGIPLLAALLFLLQ